MKCLIGNEDLLQDKIEKIINYKMSLLDETVTFNYEKSFDIEYLRRIHIYLFAGIYEEAGELRETLNEEDLEKISSFLTSLEIISRYYDSSFYNEFNSILDYIKDMQPFYDGNKRTINAFVKQLITIFNLPIGLESSKVTNESVMEKSLTSNNKSVNI